MMMYDKLTFHKSHVSGEFPDPIFMVGSSLLKGPSFTNQYADEWKIARLKWLNTKFVLEPDVIPSFTMSSYDGAFFPYDFIFFKDEVNDYEAMFGSTEESPEALELVEQICAEISEKLISDEEILMDPPIEEIYRPIATGGFDGEKSTPEWELEFDRPGDDYEDEILICLRSQAPKRPSEFRDIGIMKPSSLRFHRRIMWLLKKCVQRIPGCRYGRDQEYTDKIVSRIGSRSDHFYMRDYTKSGMTIPHSVQNAVFRGFYRRRPELAERCQNFFTKQQLFIKNDGGTLDVLHPETGSPLGLFVEGYTILQYAIHEINKAELSGLDLNCLFSATNDDMVVGFNTSFEAWAYQQADERINSELGMSYKDSKSGVSSNRFVFCETYWVDDKIADKSMLFATSIIGARYALNTFHAKEYCYAIMTSSSGVTPVMRKALREVQADAGHEFHEDEYNWPFLFGGWLPCIKKGLDHSIEWYDGDIRASAGYWASRARLSHKGSLGSEPHLTLGRKIDIRLVAEPEDIETWMDLIPLLGTRRTLKRHYRLSHSNPKSVAKEYKILQDTRVRLFNSFCEGKKDLPPVYEGWIQRHPKTYWPTVFPYLVSEKAMAISESPKCGLQASTFKSKLIGLQKKGCLSVSFSEPVSNTFVKFSEVGIQFPFTYSKLPLGRSGISTEVLKIQPPGLQDWWERTGQVPLSICEGDEPFKCTELWTFAPWVPLAFIYRMYNYMTEKYGGNLSENHLFYAADVLKGIHQQDNPRDNWLVDEDDFEPPEERALVLESYIRDVIRDWVPDADAIIESIRDRLIPLPMHLRGEEYSRTVNLQTSNNSFTLLGPSAPRDSDRSSTEGSEPSDSVFDPWGELGVT